MFFHNSIATLKLAVLCCFVLCILVQDIESVEDKLPSSQKEYTAEIAQLAQPFGFEDSIADNNRPLHVRNKRASEAVCRQQIYRMQRIWQLCYQMNKDYGAATATCLKGPTFAQIGLNMCLGVSEGQDLLNLIRYARWLTDLRDEIKRVIIEE
ncbi:uncharacterized protein LOC129581944 [Paramacrobiotus metropolitanus]|uniref:uncharacterized protein LOC129581944 n=1 Tax=Paramacrobiotus metropolitanus TaxID=2943436 RepID=UPI0024461B45|nr:uncharacterized protein LOC129581944 [Paramacrobiotus metropolitanus]